MYSVLNMYLTYQKTLVHTFFCLFLKFSKAFSVSLIAMIEKLESLDNEGGRGASVLSMNKL